MTRNDVETPPYRTWRVTVRISRSRAGSDHWQISASGSRRVMVVPRGQLTAGVLSKLRSSGDRLFSFRAVCQANAEILSQSKKDLLLVRVVLTVCDRLLEGHVENFASGRQVAPFASSSVSPSARTVCSSLVFSASVSH